MTECKCNKATVSKAKLAEWKVALRIHSNYLLEDTDARKVFIGRDLHAIYDEIANALNEDQEHECECGGDEGATTKLIDVVMMEKGKKQDPKVEEKEEEAGEEEEKDDAVTDCETSETFDDPVERSKPVPKKVNENHPLNWTGEELSIIRTAATADEAMKQYHRKYGNKRKDTGILQKYQKVAAAGQLVAKGSRVVCTRRGNLYNGVAGVVKGIAENGMFAYVLFDDGVNVQFSVADLEVTDGK